MNKKLKYYIQLKLYYKVKLCNMLTINIKFYKVYYYSE